MENFTAVTLLLEDFDMLRHRYNQMSKIRDDVKNAETISESGTIITIDKKAVDRIIKYFTFINDPEFDDENIEVVIS